MKFTCKPIYKRYVIFEKEIKKHLLSLEEYIDTFLLKSVEQFLRLTVNNLRWSR